MKTSSNLSNNINGNLFVPQLSVDDVIESIKTVNNKEIKVVYSPAQQTISAYIIEEGIEQLIKPEDLPKELKAVKDSTSLQLLLENSYARASYLSNGDVKLYMEQRGLGGGKEDRTSPYWKKLLSNVKELVEERNGGELGLKAFISYAWEDTSTDAGKAANGKLQRWLEGLRDDLQEVGVSVFLDIGDMHGDMGKRMRENLNDSDIILTINTPRYAQRATAVPQTNLGFEYELTLKKAEVNPKSVVTLHYDGELDKAYPETLKHFPRYDCRKLEDYSEHLVGSKGLPGIIPTILGINIKEDAGYQSLVKEWREEKLNYLPEENKEFVGRTEQLEKLEKALETKPVQAISGKEGIGKSELALKYASSHAEEYKIVRWINAEPGNLKKEFKQMAQELAINTKGLNLTNIIAAVQAHLKSIPNWLLIFDGVMDRNSVESYLPKPTEKGQHVIITSRSNEKWKGQVEVKAFSKVEAWKYIHQKLPSVSQSQAIELAHKVQYSPSKLYQAAEYINFTGISLPYYIKTHLSSATKSKEIVTEASSKIITTEREEQQKQEKTSEGTTTNSQKVSLVESNNTTSKASKDPKSSKTDSVSGTEKKSIADFPSLLNKIKEEVLPQIKKEQAKAYISYAPEDVTTPIGEEKNEKMQSWIEKLQGSLEQAGIVVTISSRDIHGNIEPEAEIALKNSDAIILINTPTYKQQVLSSAETGLGYEYKQILERAKEIPYGMLPLLYSGGFGESVPKELWGFLVRDCTNDSAYEENLIAPQNPKGIIPGIYNIDCDDTPQYRSLVQEYRWHKATSLPTANPNFLGREEVLAQLAKSFEEAKDANSQRQVVSATGGMGKSELAITYANKHASEYDMVRWLNTEGDKLSLEFNQVATELGIDTKGMALKDLIKAVHRALDEIPRYLLVFDNADNASAIKDYLPPQNKEGHHLIITSRSQQWSNCIVLDTFSPEECWSYISTKVKDADKHHALELAKSVGYLPLALSQAVAYIQQEGVTITGYLENYKAKGVEQGNDKVMGTWSMSMEKVKEKSPDAAFMLEACSYLNPDNIPLSLFEHPGLLGDPIKVQEAVRVLREYSLVQSSKVDNQIREHRLVQEASRSKEEATQTSEKIIKKAAKLKTAIELCYPKDKVKASDYEVVRELVPHVESLAENLKPYASVVQGRIGVKELLQAHLKKTDVTTKINDEPTKEEINQERFAAKMSDKLNAGAILQADLLSMVSDGLYTLGEYNRSKEVLQKVLDIRERHYGNDTPEVAITLTSLGITLKELGDYTASKEVLERALKIQEAHYKAENPDIAVTLTALGITLYSTGDYAASQEVLEKALKIKESHYGKDSPKAAATLTALASSLYALKDYASSKELLNRALNIEENYYGMDHPEVAATLTALGDTLHSLRDYTASKEALERALKIQENQYGLNHLKVASTLTSLHNTLKELGDHVGSRVALERAIIIEESNYGVAHPQVTADLLKLAIDIQGTDDRVSSGIGDSNTNSKAALEEAIRILEAHYGEKHLIVATALDALSYQMQELADYGAKQLLLERVLQIKEQHYGTDHPKIISTLGELAQVFDKLGGTAAQKTILEKLLKIKKYYYGLDHIELSSTLEKLTEVANKEGDTKVAKELVEKTLKIKEGYYGKDHPQLISSLESLSKVASNEGNILAQKEILTRILKITDNYYKQGSKEILDAAVNLQKVLRKLDNVKDREENATKILEILSKQSDTNYLEIIFKDGHSVNTKNKDGKTALIMAAENGHEEVALTLIDQGANVNDKDNRDNTALMKAAANGLGEVVLALIDQGANVNDKDNTGYTVLMGAAASGHGKVALTLIEKGANVNDKGGYYGKTALLMAIENWHEEVAVVLINQGANINDKDNEGKTPLISALAKGYKEAVLVMIEKGVNVNDKDKYGYTPLIMAVGNIEVALALINHGANVNDENNYGKTPLILAVEEGHEEVALALIEKGANVNKKGNSGDALLTIAICRGYEKVALALINNGADVNDKDNYHGKTALIWAVENRLGEVALELIEKGANVNDKDNSGNTALMGAAEKGLEKVILTLLDRGANVNDKNNNGNTALMGAAEKGYREVALALIDKDANVNDKNNDSKTALIKAAENGHGEVALVLIDKGAGVNDKGGYREKSVLMEAIEKELREVALVLIDKGANVNDKDNEGNTVLMGAAEKGLGEVARVLIDKGVNVNDKGYRDKTALMGAAENGHEEIVLALMEKGANINDKDNEGKTALIKAAENGHGEVALALIEKGANVDDKTNGGSTALMAAAASGLEEVTLILIEKGASVNDKGYQDKTALIKAAENGHKKVTLALINNGANINDKDSYDSTPLLMAAEKGHEEVALALIEKGANVNDKGGMGSSTVLINALGKGLRELALALINNGANVNDKDSYGSTPLLMATEKGHEKEALALIEKGANVNDKGGYYGKTPLIWAAEKGLEKVTLALIDKGADVNDKDKYPGFTPLIHATVNRHEKVALALINNAANVNDKDNHGRTVLTLMEAQNKEEAVKLLQAKIAEKQSKEIITVNAVTDIIYDNDLLNHSDLLKEPLKVLSLGKILDMSLNLDQRLLDEAVSNNDSSLVLAGLISLGEENNYE